MSNASPLKEPSMDEILASIRRIIESGDERPNASVRPRAVSESLRARAVAMQAEAVPGLRAAPGHGDGPRAALADRAAAAPDFHDESGPAGHAAEEEPAEEAPADWPTPLANLASLSANDRPAPSLRRAAPEVEPPRGVDDEDGRFSRASHDLDDRPAAAARVSSPPPEFGACLALTGLRPASIEYPSRVEASAAPAEPPPEPAPYDFNLEFDEESFSSELRDEVVSAFSQADQRVGDADVDHRGHAESPAVANAAPPSLIAETSSLMSEAAGAQVASAFDELARAIREGQMKSMEEMARHMLRPMLQEWLDDNLPRIVERLVREEIERVARGGRR